MYEMTKTGIQCMLLGSYNDRKISGLMRSMLARECVSENAGVAGC